jgi:hypothetical protein
MTLHTEGEHFFSSPHQSQDVSPEVAVMHIMNSAMIAQAVSAATKIGVPDILADGPKTGQELAQMTGAHEASLRLLLRGLAAVGVFDVTADNRYAATPLSMTLTKGKDTKRAHVLYTGEASYRMWASLEQTIMTSRSAFSYEFGMERYEYLQRNPEVAGWFNEFMAQTVHQWLLPAIETCDLSSAQTIVDVGGGNGTVLASVLTRHAHLHGILFDLPDRAHEAAESLAAAGVGERSRVVGGDFLSDALPQGGDIYLLSRVLFNWNESDARKILHRCRAAMTDNARLLVIELVLPGGEGPSHEALMALHLLAGGGWVLNQSEWQARMQACGFRIAQITSRPAVTFDHQWSTIEAVPH